MNCNSCGVSVAVDTSWIEFDCPSCGKEKIVRCGKCKRMINKYKCAGCGFSGP
ncbi:MAG TPA: zinc finger domain-containing protein [archaeon]|nr:zinc finger domain-containing protein [archaeon]